MSFVLSQNIDNGAANAVGVAVVRVGGNGIVLDRADGFGRSHGTALRGILNVGRSERITTTRNSADGDGIVSGNTNIHTDNVDPLWRSCKRNRTAGAR